MDAVELAFEAVREESTLFTIPGKFAKKPDNAGLNNDQFEIATLSRTMDSLTIPKFNQHTEVMLSITGTPSTDVPEDALGRCPFELALGTALVFKLKIFSDVTVDGKTDVV
ncbi:hypothetical protein N0V94_001015 [Neodidymelliopsis sp. IMI 364377]|nr:hypothetical protein N0V94_001015 [Neodidymelliopsis sp. IMI 364377]